MPAVLKSGSFKFLEPSEPLQHDLFLHNGVFAKYYVISIVFWVLAAASTGAAHFVCFMWSWTPLWSRSWFCIVMAHLFCYMTNRWGWRKFISFHISETVLNSLTLGLGVISSNIGFYPTKNLTLFIDQS